MPLSDNQRSIIDNLAAEVALACREKEATEVRLQEAKLRRDAYHNGETAKLREQGGR